MANDERYKKGRYKTEIHYFPGSTDSERKSFGEGVESGRENPYLHAYFVGVGFAKGAAGDTLGFKNDEQRKRFEAGVRDHQQHFVTFTSASEEADGPSFFGKLFGWFGASLRRLFAWLNGSFAKAKNKRSERKDQPRKMKVKGEELTLKREKGKRYKITGGSHVNKKKSAKRMTAKRRK